MNETVEEIVVTIGAALGALVARRLLAKLGERYLIWDARSELEKGLPGWAKRSFGS